MSARGLPRKRRIHLAARFPGAGDTAGFSSFEHLARTAERGLFDFLCLAEGPRPRERQGRVHDPDVAGRPEPITVLNALAAVTERVGLAAAVDAAFDEPYGLARRLATLDHLSGGRAAWHVVTPPDALTGEDSRAAEFLATARELWDSWTPDGVSRPFAHRGRHFDIAGEFTVPRPPQGHPVVIQAGNSDEGRESAAAGADVVLTRHGSLEAGRSCYADVKRRLERYGRAPDELKVMPGVTVVLGDSAADARERAAEVGPQQAAPRAARAARAARSVRRTVLEAGERRSFVGTPEAVAAEMEESVRRGAADGFVLVPHPAPGGLDEFVDRVVPLLQERGAFRTEYEGTTLRSHLGLPDPVSNG